MPAPGEQHRLNAASANPYEDSTIRVTSYTAQEIATLQSRLDKQLGPEYVSSRPGAGGSKVHYLAAEKVINLANEVFGFNGWSSQIQCVQVDFCDENPNTGKISIGLSVITRVTLKDGTFHEDIGYGQIENCKGKAAAFEKAKKEGATDALKRALRTFGNVLGNCLYDKDYLSKITKVKAAPTKWDPVNLHRHADYLLTKKEATAEPDSRPPPLSVAGLDSHSMVTELDDDFGGNLFDEVDLGAARPDEVVVHPSSRPQTPRPPQVRDGDGPQPGAQYQQQRPSAPLRNFTTSIPSAQNSHIGETRPPSPQNVNSIRPIPSPNHAEQRAPREQNQSLNTLQNGIPTATTTINSGIPPDQINQQTEQPRAHEPPVDFITSRAANLLQDANPPDTTILNSLPRFNPMADSPSIRKTSGVNHATSGPVLRAAILGGAANANTNSTPAPANNAPNRPAQTSFVNLPENLQRRIGAPTGGMSPMSNRTAYKPPTMAGVKRQINGQVEGAGFSRPPLADVSNTAGQNGDISGDLAKKQKMGDAVCGHGEP